jgi:magnesium transporter
MLFRKKPNDIFNKKRSKAFHHQATPGSEPGTLIAHPDLMSVELKMQLIAYNERDLVEVDISDPTEIKPYLEKYTVTWLNVVGLGDIDALQKIASIFNFHALAMEDVANVHQRPKIEEYDGCMFGVTRIPEVTGEELTLPQFSFFWGSNYVVTFEESFDTIDNLDPTRIRIKNGGRRQRLLRPDYLTYAILDTIIDSYFPIVEFYGSKLDDIEEKVIQNPSANVVVSIHNFKHYLMQLRRAIWSQREALRTLSEYTKTTDRDMRFFIRDCEDHTIQIIDILETYRERTSGLMDVYLSSISNKMNSTIKILTAIATIFMPLTFIAGVYGMNFKTDVSPWNMPELSWRFGYFYALGLFLVTGISLGVLFWRNGWFKSK